MENLGDLWWAVEEKEAKSSFCQKLVESFFLPCCLLGQAARREGMLSLHLEGVSPHGLKDVTTSRQKLLSFRALLLSFCSGLGPVWTQKQLCA